MKKFRCGKCGEEFVGRLEICPKCGVELHYLDQEVKKEQEVVKTGPKLYFEDEDVIKTGIGNESFYKDDVSPVTTTNLNPELEKERKRLAILPDAKSYFDGSTLQLFCWRLLGTILFIITLGLAFPWIMCMIYRWETKHTVISGYRLAFDGKGSQLFGRYLLWLLLCIVTFGIFAIFVANKIKMWKTKHTVFADAIK